MGDPVGLKRLDKWFVDARRGGEATYEWISGAWNDAINMNRQAPLPLQLLPESAWLEVYVSDDVSGQASWVECLQLRLQVSGDLETADMGVKFNGIELGAPRITTVPSPGRVSPG